MDAHTITGRLRITGRNRVLERAMQDIALLVYAETDDRRCAERAVDKLEEALMWAEKGTEGAR